MRAKVAVDEDVASPSDLINVAIHAARERLPANSVDRVEIAPMIASDGQDALRVSVVLSDAFDGDLAADLLMRISLEVAWAIERAGDDRYAFVEYREGSGSEPEDDAAA